MIMRTGLSANAGEHESQILAEVDPLLVCAMLSGHSFDKDPNSILKTSDFFAGHNHVRKALRSISGVRIRPHADVLRSMRDDRERISSLYLPLSNVETQGERSRPLPPARLAVRELVHPPRACT
jgi:hypothetical protein